MCARLISLNDTLWCSDSVSYDLLCPRAPIAAAKSSRVPRIQNVQKASNGKVILIESVASCTVDPTTSDIDPVAS